MTGLYLHIPFCHARCGYCDFVTFTGKEDKIDKYVDGLIEELTLLARAPETNVESLSTIFFGGGTPSLLSGAQVGKILAHVNRLWGAASREVTLEANPESLTPASAASWRDAGVNRLSIGLQSFDNELLKKMGRLHTAEEFVAAYQTARRAGFTNLSIDLIYGFEGQRFQSWEDTLARATALSPEHLSLYALTVEEHTPFAAQRHAVDLDAQGRMYDHARRFLSSRGYAQYEISNFSKAGRACAHNLIYWRQQPYLGAGVGAVGCVGGRRWQVHKDFDSYYNALAKGELPWKSVETLDAPTRKFERLMLGLRLREGMRWDDEENEQWRKEREKLRQKGLLEETAPGVWRVCEAAVGLTNQVMLPFL
jgi:oxygen-independent coproporphyrinogen III oxidase